jgi:hypothetical protein
MSLVHIAVTLDVTPGTLTDDASIKADVVSAIDGLVGQLGFAYGEPAYTVNGAKVS